MNKQSGQLLLEILIAIVAVVAIAALGAQLILVGQRSNKITGDKDTALKLVEETFAAVRSISTEDWQIIYGVTKGVAYQPIQSSGKWSLTTGSEIVTIINGVNYTRSFYIENVSRDGNGNIELVYNSANDDPSTQKITASVSWPNGDTVTGSEYITRWRGKGCVQTDWTTSGGGMSACPSTSYESATNLSTGTDLIIQ